MRRKLGRKAKRSKRGSIPAVFCMVILLVVIMFACLGVDVAHNTQVRDQLQTATDAGALAGVRELALNTPTTADIARANDYAAAITGANESDGKSISNAEPSTNVNITVDPATNIRRVTVIATRTVGNVFAHIIGWGTSQVSSRSVAAAYRGLSTVDPGVITPIAIDIDYTPSSGPSANQTINQMLNPGQTITVTFNSNFESNAAWVRTWGNNADTNTTPVIIGENYEVMNGVRASTINGLNVGDTLNALLVNGGPPYNQSRTALGVISLKVIAKGTTQGKHWITFTVNEPMILPGTPGAPNLNTSAANQNFLNTWSPWQIALVE